MLVDQCTPSADEQIMISSLALLATNDSQSLLSKSVRLGAVLLSCATRVPTVQFLPSAEEQTRICRLSLLAMNAIQSLLLNTVRLGGAFVV